MADVPAGWSLLVPVKDLVRAKSRLLPPPGVERAALARAFALDTLSAAQECAQVEQVVLVSDDPSLHHEAHVRRLQVVSPAPDGLNPALQHAASLVRAPRIAALTGDLPALRPKELGEALERAAEHAYAVVPDAVGSGTTLLAAADGTRFRPRYGVNSFARHTADGAFALEAGPSVRSDVDAVQDLEVALGLGVGRATRALLLLQAGA